LIRDLWLTWASGDERGRIIRDADRRDKCLPLPGRAMQTKQTRTGIIRISRLIGYLPYADVYLRAEVPIRQIMLSLYLQDFMFNTRGRARPGQVHIKYT